jgi:hypothetical protein
MRSAPESSGSATAARFLAVLRAAPKPLNARRLKQALIAEGEPAAVVDAAWRRAQPVLRRHPEIEFDAARGFYHHRDAAPVEPGEALELLLPARITGRQAGLANVVRHALAERSSLQAGLRTGSAGSRERRGARERQIRLDVVRVLVDVVAEVEELTAAGAEPAVVAERVRGLAEAFGLRAVGRAGEQTTFDPDRHTPIGNWPSDEEAVLVLRPGYTWHHGRDVVLVAKAQVASVVHSGGSGDTHGGA